MFDVGCSMFRTTKRGDRNGVGSRFSPPTTMAAPKSVQAKIDSRPLYRDIMNPGNLTAGAGALRQALQLLRLRWADAKEQWNDQVSQEFEEKYIVELERA